MSIPYLNGKPWSCWTRDECYFCSVLYCYARKDPAEFAAWLIGRTGLRAKTDGAWDLGYEVCLYRDFLWHIGKSARSRELPQKRTFDLCLFGTRAVIVIEAKVFERFESKQAESVAQDKKLIPCLPGFERVKVYAIALATSRYFGNAAKHGRPETLNVFDGCLTWGQAAKKYPDARLDQAENMYKMKAGRMLDGGSA